MTPRHRDQILQIADGCVATFPYLHFLYNMTRCDEIFYWLLKNAIVGERFHTLIRYECGGSFLKVSSFILSKIEKEKELRPIYRRDLKPSFSQLL